MARLAANQFPRSSLPVSLVRSRTHNKVCKRSAESLNAATGSRYEWTFLHSGDTVFPHPILGLVIDDCHSRKHSFCSAAQQNDLDGLEQDQQIQPQRHVFDVEKVVAKFLLCVLK